MRHRLGVLISGRGSNLQAIVDATRSGSLEAEVAVVISNRRQAAGLVRATEAGIESLCLDPRDYADRDAYDRALADAFRARGVSLVCLAGYMRLVGLPLLDAFRDRVLNIHPSLLPAFRGLDAQKQALEHGVKITGATVHIVNAELDAGPIVMQAAVPVLPDDTVESLSARILVEEHRIYPLAIAQILSGTVGTYPIGDTATGALFDSIPFDRNDRFRIVVLRGGEDDLSRELRHRFASAQIKTFDAPFDVASLAWWDVMYGADLVVAPFVMAKLTDAKKQYLFKAIADRVSARGGVLVVDRVDTAHGALLHHLIWLRHAGFADVDCRWRVRDLAVFGGFTPRAAAASAPPPPAGN